MPEKIVFVPIQYPPTIGGLQSYIKGLVDAVEEIGYEAAVITSTPNPDMKMEGEVEGSVIQLHSWFWFMNSPIINPLKFYKSLKTLNPDVVNLVYPFPIYLDIACFYAILHRKKICCTYIDDVIMKFPYSLIMRIYEMTIWNIWKRSISSMAVLSGEYGKNASGLKNWTKNMYEVPPPVFDTDFNLSVEKKLAAKNKLNLADYNNIALFVGGLRQRLTYKRLDLVLKAWKLHKNENSDNSLLLIVGDGELRSYYEDMASKLGLGPKDVIFKGFVSKNELIDCYLASNVFLLPSEDNNEAFGIASVEAMLYGNAVIASDIPGLRGSVKIKKSSTSLIKNSNPQKIFNHLKYWFSKDTNDYSIENHLYVKECMHKDQIKQQLTSMLGSFHRDKVSENPLKRIFFIKNNEKNTGK
jgi:glycosyltransferase involved in cell wall biosynthesis